MFLLWIWFWDDHSCFVFGQSIFLNENNESQIMSHTRLPVQSWVDNHKYAHHYCLDHVHRPRCPFRPVRWLVGDGGRPIMGTIDDYFRFYKTDVIRWRHHDVITRKVQNSRVWNHTMNHTVLHGNWSGFWSITLFDPVRGFLVRSRISFYLEFQPKICWDRTLNFVRWRHRDVIIKTSS